MVSTRSRTVALRSRRFKEEEGETGDSERNGIIVTPESIKTNVASDVKQRKIRNRKITSTALNSTNANKPNQYNGIIDINRSVVLESYGGNDSTIPDFSSFTFQTTPDKQQLSHNWLNFDSSKNDDNTKLTFETSSPDFATPSIDTKLSFPLPSSSSKTNKRKKTVHQETTSKTKEADKIEPPIGWEDIYSIVEELRSDRTAPVDLCGPAVIIEKHLGEKVFRFQVLIALMLSSQTKDNVVCDAMKKLQRHGLTVENIQATSDSKLNELIYSVGFHNAKTKYIKQVAEILATQYDGDIPNTADEMIARLPGVGPKMAYIVESIAHNQTTGIGVDTHMHRMFNQLNWVRKSDSPEKTRLHLQGWLPKDKWKDVNFLWVGFGQETQQQKEKVLRKAIACTRPMEALTLLNRVGLNYKVEAVKYGLQLEVDAIIQRQRMGTEEYCAKPDFSSFRYNGSTSSGKEE